MSRANPWIKFPDRVWEQDPSGLWSSRPATRRDWIDRELVAETLGCRSHSKPSPIDSSGAPVYDTPET